jgi:hypothetical protein
MQVNDRVYESGGARLLVLQVNPLSQGTRKIPKMRDACGLDA